jgi:hypothetical protein
LAFFINDCLQNVTLLKTLGNLQETPFGVVGEIFVPFFDVLIKVLKIGTSFPSSSFDGIGVNA